MKTIFVKPDTVERKWYLIDASRQRLGRVAVKAANIVRGKRKALYTPHQEIGDYCIIVNAEKAELTGAKAQNKMYYRHSGYPGGIRSETYLKLVERKPTAPMEKAVRGMLPKGPLGRKLFKNIKIYAGPEHPHTAQKPEQID